MRKPLGRLAAALLAGVAIPLAIAPSAFATGPALTVDQPNDPASTVGKEFKDNTASGVDLANGTGILRIASAAGVPTNITSKFFDVIDGPYQAEEDGRFWDVTVKLHKGHDFKKGGVDVSWHCGGHSPKPPKESKKPTSAPATTSTPATSDAPPTSETPIATVTPTEPPSVLPTSESPATETSSVETSTVESATSESPTSESSQSESPSSSDSTTTGKPTSDTNSATPTTDTNAPQGGDVVDCPVKPVPSGGSTPPAGKPQVSFVPKGGVETGFGGLEQG